MASRSPNAGSVGFLSPEIVRFLHRRILELVGFSIFLVGAIMLIVTLGYHPSDPSWSHSNSWSASNPIGHSGAWVADLLIQSLGTAAVLPGLIISIWGCCILFQKSIGRIWLRITSFPITLLLGALSLAALNIPVPWSAQIAPGGFTGTLLFTYITTHTVQLSIPSWVNMVGFPLIALASLLVSLGLSQRQWSGGFKRALQMSTLTARVSIVSGTWSGRIARRIGKLSYRPFNKLYANRESSLEDIASNGDTVSDQYYGDSRREPTLRRLEKLNDAPEVKAGSERKIVAAKQKKPALGKRASVSNQRSLDLDVGGYELPPLEALDELSNNSHASNQDEEALSENARLLESVLEDFGVRGRIVKVRPGPVVTLYELEPAPGTKSSRVISLADDIARSMSAVSVRVAVVPGKNVIGIELPNALRELVSLRELVEAKAYEQHTGALTLALGKDIGGTPTMVDLARMPHLLIAGTTGSGKSVAVNTMIMSLLYRLTPEQCKFIMIDPKMLELSVYDDIPHLLAPVVTDPAKAVVALRWAVREMEERYRSMSNLGVRNINGFNHRITEAAKKGETLTRTVQTGFDRETGDPIYEEQNYDMQPLPYIVVIVDEMADLMMVSGKEVEAAVQRLAQMARAAGIHLIMATQRPSVDVITGTIKANFPTRVSFQVTSKIDSRTILGEGGAEQLLGQGDMLYMAAGGRVARVHGPFVSDFSVERVVGFLRAQGEPEYVDEVTEGEHESPFIPNDSSHGPMTGNASGDDRMYDQALAIICREQKASTSFVQRQLQIGYNRAARIIERMEAEGVISKPNHAGKREVLAQNVVGAKE